MRISCAVIITSTAWRNALTSNSPLSSRNDSRLSEARLQAELSRCMYSLHGLDALIRPELGQVCHALMVVSNCIGIAASPGRLGDHLDQIAGAEFLGNLVALDKSGLPVGIV